MVNSNLVIMNGLGLEEGLESAVESARSDGANVFEIAPLLKPHPFSAASPETEDHSLNVGRGNGDEVSGSRGGYDPHVWLDMARTSEAAALLGEQFTAVTGDEKFTACGDQVAEDIMVVNTEITAVLGSVPEGRRVLVTDHDALGYFSERYGYEVVGVVIPGGSTLGQPSSEEVVALVETIKSKGVSTIFVNAAADTTLPEMVASEVGNVKIVPLYIDSVGGNDSPAVSYQEMMRINAARISSALKS